MNELLENEGFAADFRALEQVSLDPSRHAAPNARVHSEWVADRAAALGRANGRPDSEVHLLRQLGLAHDIGKASGTAAPSKSVELIESYGSADPQLLGLVKYHDTNLPWFRAAERGQAPSEKAWRKMGRALDPELLCLFMVADRVDCPGGWESNPPLAWFLAEARSRGLVREDLVLNVPGPRYEVFAGVALIRAGSAGLEVLLIRTRQPFEVPKGHVEWGEQLETAALRELAEETGLSSPISGEQVQPLGTITYAFGAADCETHKTVHYYTARPPALEFTANPSRTNELRWARFDEVPALPLASEELRRLVMRALSPEFAGTPVGRTP